MERCGPYHDGTWTKAETGSTKFSKLELEEFRSCLIDFAHYAYRCDGDLMYLKTKECETLAEFWQMPSYLPEADLILPKDAKPINLWIYIPLGLLVIVMFYFQIKRLYADMAALAK